MTEQETTVPFPDPPPLPRLPDAVPLPPAPLVPPQPAPLVPPAGPPPVVDALGSMLAGSTHWSAVPTAVSPLVTLSSWAVLAADALVLLRLARSQLVGLLALLAATGLLALVGVASAGFRRANRGWLLAWFVGFVFSAVAGVVLVVALVAG
jgi:hypothetical protein